jgi:hypothetical protein
MRSIAQEKKRLAGFGLINFGRMVLSISYA